MIVFIRSVRSSVLEMISEAVGFPFREDKGQVNQVIYQDNAPRPEAFLDARSDEDRKSRALRRSYIDIGAGIPDWDSAEDEETGETEGEN